MILKSPLADTGSALYPYPGSEECSVTSLSSSAKLLCFFVHCSTGPDCAPCGVHLFLYLLCPILKQILNTINFLESVWLLKTNSYPLKFGSLSQFISLIVTSLQFSWYNSLSLSLGLVEPVETLFWKKHLIWLLVGGMVRGSPQTVNSLTSRASWRLGLSLRQVSCVHCSSARLLSHRLEDRRVCSSLSHE